MNEREPYELGEEPDALPEEDDTGITIVMPQQNDADPYVLGVVAFGATVIVLLSVMAVLLSVMAVMLDRPLVLFQLVVAAAMAYLNYSFLHALRGDYAAWLGYRWLVRLSTLTACVSVFFVLYAAYGLYQHLN